jgi:glutaredoxin
MFLVAHTHHRTTGQNPTKAGLATTALLLCALSLPAAQAQGVYRIVGPDGKVSFSDQPPSDAKNAEKMGSTGTPSSGVTRPNLPFELQQLVAKYPVTLYSTQGCGPCDSGRSLLAARGVPYTEKTVNTALDAAAFERVNAENALPLLVIGGQQVKGYSATEWGRYLDAAGYPKTSMLPSGYRPQDAQPLAPLKTASESPTPNGSAPGQPPAIAVTAPPARKIAPPTTNANNPAGIKF